MQLKLQILTFLCFINILTSASDRSLLPISPDSENKEQTEFAQRVVDEFEKRELKKRRCCSLSNCLLFLLTSSVSLLTGFGIKAYYVGSQDADQITQNLRDCRNQLDTIRQDCTDYAQKAMNFCEDSADTAITSCNSVAQAAINQCERICPRSDNHKNKTD